MALSLVSSQIQAAPPAPYDLDPLFERAVGLLAVCGRGGFWRRIGPLIEPEGFVDEAVSDAVALARAVARTAPGSVPSAAAIAQAARAKVLAGKLTEARARAVRRLCEDALEGDAAIPEDQAVGVLVEIIRRRKEKAAIDGMLTAFGARRDLSEARAQLEEAARIDGAAHEGKGDAIVSTHQVLDAISRLRGQVTLGTGIPQLDNANPGPGKKTLSAVVTEPEGGKTAFLTSWFAHALASGFPAGFITLEDSEEGICSRVYANLCEVDISSLRTDAGLNLLARRLHEVSARGLIAAGAIQFFPARITKVADIAEWFDRQRETLPMEALFVDYCQIIGATNTRAPRHEQQEEVVEQLRGLAQTRDCMVMTGAQIKIDAMKNERKGRAPSLADIAGSSGIGKTMDQGYALRFNREDGTFDYQVIKSRSYLGGGQSVEAVPHDLARGRIAAIDRGWFEADSFDGGGLLP